MLQVVHCTGYVHLRHGQIDDPYANSHAFNMGLMAIGFTLPPNQVTELRLPVDAFMLRTDLRLNLRHIEQRSVCTVRLACTCAFVGRAMC